MLQALLFWVSGVATILTSSLGVVGNLLSLAVLSKKVSYKTTFIRRRGEERQDVDSRYEYHIYCGADQHNIWQDMS